MSLSPEVRRTIVIALCHAQLLELSARGHALVQGDGANEAGHWQNYVELDDALSWLETQSDS